LLLFCLLESSIEFLIIYIDTKIFIPQQKYIDKVTSLEHIYSPPT
jgi:hypothetical protein